MLSLGDSILLTGLVLTAGGLGLKIIGSKKSNSNLKSEDVQKKISDRLEEMRETFCKPFHISIKERIDTSERNIKERIDLKIDSINEKVDKLNDTMRITLDEIRKK